MRPNRYRIRLRSQPKRIATVTELVDHEQPIEEAAIRGLAQLATPSQLYRLPEDTTIEVSATYTLTWRELLLFLNRRPHGSADAAYKRHLGDLLHGRVKK